MATEKDYIFDSPKRVAGYLFHKYGDLSPLKLQKALYFLFAYHGAVYARGQKDGELEGTKENLKLFNVEFEAWKYGPVIREVYTAEKNGEFYDSGYLEECMNLVEQHAEERKFIDDLFEQINKVSDFSLVDRSHQDKAWEKVYQKDGVPAKMHNEQIIEEYASRYV